MWLCPFPAQTAWATHLPGGGAPGGMAGEDGSGRSLGEQAELMESERPSAYIGMPVPLWASALDGQPRQPQRRWSRATPAPRA